MQVTLAFTTRTAMHEARGPCDPKGLTITRPAAVFLDIGKPLTIHYTIASSTNYLNWNFRVV